jgi:hypothetical protein
MTHILHALGIVASIATLLFVLPQGGAAAHGDARAGDGDPAAPDDFADVGVGLLRLRRWRVRRRRVCRRL